VPLPCLQTRRSRLQGPRSRGHDQATTSRGARYVLVGQPIVVNNAAEQISAARVKPMTPTFPPFVDIKAVTFDVGGTLIRPWPSVGHVYAEIAARHGLGNLTAEFLEDRFRTIWGRRFHLTETRSGWEQLVDEAFAGLAEVPPSRSFFPELYERFAQADVWRIYDDVPPVLERLPAQGFRLAVISNWDERLRALLRHLQLDSHFETIVVSCEVGHPKPDRAIFEQAALKLGLPAGRILHIGDSAEMDLEGARDAGFNALRIDRTAPEPGPDHLRSMLELPERLQS
jgi:putative hydrolase of the HAD superfamily